MAAVTTVYAGALAPESIAVILTSGTSGLDMTTISAVVLRARINGETADWPTTLSGQTPTSLVATHAFAANDVPSPGTFRVMPVCTVPAGTRRCQPFQLNVVQ